MKSFDHEVLLTGLKDIDDQHKILIQKINGFFEKTSTFHEKSDIVEIINFLESYVVEHFAFEESLHDQYDIPRKEEHEAYHIQILKVLRELVDDLKQNGYSPMIEIRIYNSLLRDIINQIEVYDKPLATAIIIKRNEENL